MFKSKEIETLKAKVAELELENQNLSGTVNNLIQTVNNDYSDQRLLLDRITELERKYEALNNEVAGRLWQ